METLPYSSKKDAMLHPLKLHILKSVGPHNLHARILKKVVKELFDVKLKRFSLVTQSKRWLKNDLPLYRYLSIGKIFDGHCYSCKKVCMKSLWLEAGGHQIHQIHDE